MKHMRNLLRVGVPLLAAAWLAIPVAVDARAPLPQFPEGRGDACVEPLDVIRRDHMDFLNHHRDQTTYLGIRTKQHSLKNCIECHATKDDEGHWVSVSAPGQFCESCHSYAAVSMDCFQCHATKPAK